MDPKYEALFTPWKIGNVEIKNRIVLCPMGGTSLFGWMEHTGNHFDEEAAKFFIEKANNNVGLIIPGIAPIRSTFMGQWLYQNKKMFVQLKEFMDEIHKTGAKLFIQITAGMGRSWAVPTPLVMLHNMPVVRDIIKPIINIPYQSMSPSELPSRWSDKMTCRAITVKEIEEIVEAFAKTAALCKEAGVDGIEVHAVHEGYLLDQFTTEYTNKRTDKYGGSFENRYRFATDIVKAIKAACGDDYPVSLRYSIESKVKAFGEGIVPGDTQSKDIGRTMDESEKAAKYLQDAGYDMLNCDNGTYDSWYWAHPPMYMPQNCNLDSVAHIKKFVDIPVVCAGRMEPDVGAKAVADGQIDGVGVARQFLADAAWVTKLMEDRLEEIRPCICCHNACFNMAHYKGVANAQSIYDASHIARCALDPMVMQSDKYKLVPAKAKKTVAVIGGGIGGMEAAIVCAKRGHAVTLYEKSDKLGGVFIAAAAPSFKEKDKALIAWYNREIAKYPIDVKLNTEITDTAALNADEVIVATGATPNRLPVKGAENAVEAIDFLLDNSKVGDNVVIIGGGLTGCEIAYELYLQGKKPTVIEAKNDLIVSDKICLANTSFLRDFFAANNVPVYLESQVTEIRKDGVTLKAKDGNTKTIPTDSTVISIGYRPAPVAKKGGKVHVIGDASKVGSLRTVIWQAWDVAMKL